MSLGLTTDAWAPALRSCGAPVPRHVGPKVFPDFATFHRLIYLAYADAERVVIHDVDACIQATAGQYLSDILHLRNIIFAQLHVDTQRKLLLGEPVYVCLMAVGGYEFSVGLLAILALGAVAVPISATATMKEALYFRRTAQASAIIATSRCLNLCSQLAKEVCAHENQHFVTIPAAEGLKQNQPPIAISDMIISSDWTLSPSAPGVIIFTSGTTGPPKGTVKKRSFFTDTAEAHARWWQYRREDVMLHVLPVHHSPGMSLTFLSPLITGGSVEFGTKTKGFDAATTWDRWLQGGLTLFSGVPTMYQRMMRYYEDEVEAKRGPSEAERYAEAARAIRVFLCGTSALPFTLQTKWSKMLGGQRRILERYGGSEFTGIFGVQPGDSNNPDGSVGKVLPGIEVKLSNGDEGEVLSKSPHMFIEYIGNAEATAAAFDAEGWYLSGDIARREGDYYFILGRASVDIIKSGGYKLSALDIEREILSLDYIAEAIVVGVDDEEFGQKVAAALVPRRKDAVITLEKLREDLRSRLSGYKMPRMLRLVQDYPRTATGKVVKKQVRDSLFPPQGHPEIQEYKVRVSKL